VLLQTALVGADVWRLLNASKRLEVRASSRLLLQIFAGFAAFSRGLPSPLRLPQHASPGTCLLFCFPERYVAVASRRGDGLSIRAEDGMPR
jgi:hypothetical protein